MSSSARFFALFLFMLLCVSLSHAQSSPKATPKTARGSVSGRVTIKDKPAAGITVGLRAGRSGFPQDKVYKAVTDNEGFYRIANIPAGSYEIAPAAPAYVAPEISGPRGKSVNIAEDEEVEDINFSLVRGGVITGKITNTDGQPLIQYQVNLFRVSDLQQQPLRQVFPAGNVQTDDRGIYRFFGVAAGRYTVACGRGEEPFAGTSMPVRLVYKQVFHPDATDHTKATIIEVREGGEAANVDIMLGVPLQTFTASGRVVDEKGQPVPNIRFTFQRGATGRFEMAGNMNVSNGRGDFIVEGLAPGKYAVVLFGNPDVDVRVETMWFDIVDQDVSGLTIKLLKGLSVSGVIVLENEDKNVFAKLLEFQLRAYVTPAQGSPTIGHSSVATISPDGTFRLPGLSPGRVNLWLAKQMLGEPPKGFTITRVEHNGVPIGGGLEIKEGDQLTGVRVHVSYGTASVRGVVTIENGPLPDGTRMFARLMKPGTPPAVLGSAPVDARGQFLIEGVPPGVYEVSVTLFGPIRTQITAKREVNVQDGIVNQVALTLDVTPPPKP